MARSIALGQSGEGGRDTAQPAGDGAADRLRAAARPRARRGGAGAAVDERRRQRAGAAAARGGRGARPGPPRGLLRRLARGPETGSVGAGRRVVVGGNPAPPLARAPRTARHPRGALGSSRGDDRRDALRRRAGDDEGERRLRRPSALALRPHGAAPGARGRGARPLRSARAAGARGLDGPRLVGISLRLRLAQRTRGARRGLARGGSGAARRRRARAAADARPVASAAGVRGLRAGSALRFALPRSAGHAHGAPRRARRARALGRRPPHAGTVGDRAHPLPPGRGARARTPPRRSSISAPTASARATSAPPTPTSSARRRRSPPRRRPGTT